MVEIRKEDLSILKKYLTSEQYEALTNAINSSIQDHKEKVWSALEQIKILEMEVNEDLFECKDPSISWKEKIGQIGNLLTTEELNKCLSHFQDEYRKSLLRIKKGFTFEVVEYDNILTGSNTKGYFVHSPRQICGSKLWVLDIFVKELLSENLIFVKNERFLSKKEVAKFKDYFWPDDVILEWLNKE